MAVKPWGVNCPWMVIVNWPPTVSGCIVKEPSSSTVPSYVMPACVRVSVCDPGVWTTVVGLSCTGTLPQVFCPGTSETCVE